MKLQNCHGNISSQSEPRWRRDLSQSESVTISEEVTKLKEAAENLNTRKRTNWVRVLGKWCDENSLENNLEMILPEQLDKVLERFTVVRVIVYLSPTTLKGKQMVFS